MNDKQLNSIIEALGTKSFSGKAMKALSDKADQITADIKDFAVAKSANSKAYLKMSAERTKLEKLLADIEGREDTLTSNLAESAERLKRICVIESELEERTSQIGALEKKTKVSIKREQTIIGKKLKEADDTLQRASYLECDYKDKILKLKAAING